MVGGHPIVAAWRIQKRNLLHTYSNAIAGDNIHTPRKQKESLCNNLNMSKVFDGVWIDSLFHRLRELGIRGRMWRLLYKSFIDFKCRTRIQNKLSNWYTLGCGIHQGGYLSLVKYLAFINSLLATLKNSGLCCVLYYIPVYPLGYADDIATATTVGTDRRRCLRCNRVPFQES